MCYNEKGEIMKNKIKIIIIVLFVIITCGCGSSDYIKDKDNKIIANPITGQNIQNNILCRPTEKKLLEIYKEHDDQLKIKMEKLPECTKFKINSNKSASLWEGIFVKPLAFLILKLGDFVNNYGISVMLIGLLIRIVLLPFSVKTQRQSENTKKANPEINRINAKYQNRNDNESQMAKSQEMMLVYKKYKVNPIGGCLISFIQLPLFFAFLQAINRVPAIFEDSFLSLKLGMTPLKGIANHEYLYIILIVLIILSTYFSFKKSMSATSGQTPEVEKSTKTMLKFMIVFISIASFSLPTAIALYWIVTNGFVVIQTWLVKKIMERENKKDKYI